MHEWEDKPGDSLTNAEIYAKLREYAEADIFRYVLPTDPIGERWVLGSVDGPLIFLKGKDQAICFIIGVNLVLEAIKRKLNADARMTRGFGAQL